MQRKDSLHVPLDEDCEGQEVGESQVYRVMHRVRVKLRVRFIVQVRIRVRTTVRVRFSDGIGIG